MVAATAPLAQQTQLPTARPTIADLDYAPPQPATSKGHKLDLYLPSGDGPFPLLIWSGGSAWMADTGKATAARLAPLLLEAGYAVAGVSIRSSLQITFPGQLHDIKAAIRWLRANAANYRIDPNRIGIAGDSSGGWTSMMAAVTGDAPALEGTVGTTGVSSAVQAALAFYPPTNFAAMDFWGLRKCDPTEALVPRKPADGPPPCIHHDSPQSPESRLIGCAIPECPEKVRAASPLTYITPADPPILILHGNSDPLVPHNQGEMLYMALNKACNEVTFISLPKAGHGPVLAFLQDDATREAATIRSTSAAGCAVRNPMPYTPSVKTVTDFFDEHLKR